MSIVEERKGLIIFGAILIVVLIAALAAYQMTGSMGIEDRYTTAVGLPPTRRRRGRDLFWVFSGRRSRALRDCPWNIDCRVLCSVQAFQDLNNLFFKRNREG